MKNTAACLSMLIWIPSMYLSIVPTTTSAQYLISGRKLSSNRHSPDFPCRHNFNTGVMATYTDIAPPPAIIADATYGIKERFSIGVMAGTTGAQSLAGLKANAVLFQGNQFNILYRMVVVYYPGRNGQYLFDRRNKFIVPWMLSMGVVDAEWITTHGIRWSIGMGLLETHCAEGMKKLFSENIDETRTMPFELFHTVQASMSVPVSNKLTFRPEVFVVMKEGHLIRKGDFKVLPINPFLKLIYTF